MAKKQVQRDPDLLGRLINNMVLAGRLLMDNRVSRGAKMIPLVVCLYILSPIDLLPDVFLPFGVVDDITVFLVGLQVFIQNTPKEVREEYQGKKKDSKPKRKIAPGTGDGQDDDDLPVVIDGTYEVRED
jgi:uncharacterized membrane protein YkvA (DUF1232 family)